MKKYSVTEINNLVKNLISGVYTDKMSIEGEISNLKYSNNNLYFTLKDNDSNINVIEWQSKNNFKYKNGDKVLITGKISFYTKNGSFSINCTHMEKTGLGQLYLEYENIKSKYENLGYFHRKKKPLPKYIFNIGILTASEGAALQDILFVLKNNSFIGNIIVKKTIVQGKFCSKSICEGIEYMNSKNIDVLLITRGGGSFEDLIGFSAENVIESIYKSKHCCISAVGHEIDFMLSDFVADIRAPTPSVGAEMICSAQKIQKNKLYELDINFDSKYIKIIETYKTKLEHIQDKILKPNEIVRETHLKIINIEERIEQIYKNKMQKQYEKIIELEKMNIQNDVSNVLEQNYCLLLKRGKLIDSIEKIKKDEKLKIKLKDGEATIIIEKITKNK